MQQYMVTVPNRQFAGKIAGIMFSNGRAILDEKLVDPFLGRDVEALVTTFKDLGYKVEPIGEENVLGAPRRAQRSG